MPRLGLQVREHSSLRLGVSTHVGFQEQVRLGLRLCVTDKVIVRLAVRLGLRVGVGDTLGLAEAASTAANKRPGEGKGGRLMMEVQSSLHGQARLACGPMMGHWATGTAFSGRLLAALKFGHCHPLSPPPPVVATRAQVRVWGGEVRLGLGFPSARA